MRFLRTGSAFRLHTQTPRFTTATSAILVLLLHLNSVSPVHSMRTFLTRSMSKGTIQRTIGDASRGLGLRKTQSTGSLRGMTTTTLASSTTANGQVAPAHNTGGAMYQVVFVRHGQSTWNKANRFIGWTDTELTEQGLAEARNAGRILRECGVGFDEVHTSVLRRSIKTAWLILEELGLEHVPVVTDWRLNERSYGALVGMNKKECVAMHGAEQVKRWRRSYDERPPAMSPDHEHYPGRDVAKYGDLETEAIPLTESLRDTRARAARYWDEVLVPAIRSGKRIAVVGHENNLRALLMHIDGISKDDVMDVEIPRAMPLMYNFDADLRPIKAKDAAVHISGAYLCPKAELAEIQERDKANVYNLDIKENLEELLLQEATRRIQTSGQSAGMRPISTSTSKPSPSRRVVRHTVGSGGRGQLVSVRGGQDNAGGAAARPPLGVKQSENFVAIEDVLSSMNAPMMEPKKVAAANSSG